MVHSILLSSNIILDSSNGGGMQRMLEKVICHGMFQLCDSDAWRETICGAPHKPGSTEREEGHVREKFLETDHTNSFRSGLLGMRFKKRVPLVYTYLPGKARKFVPVCRGHGFIILYVHWTNMPKRAKSDVKNN
jgi:hypothetical protein